MIVPALFAGFVLIVAVRLIFNRPAPIASSSEAMLCPTCGYDVRANPERCPECGTAVPRWRRSLDPAKLRDEWPLSPIVPRVPGLWETPVRVWDAPHSFAAQLLIEQFEQRGIRAIVSKQFAPMAVGNYVAPPADYSVAVWSSDVDAANAILDRFSVDALETV